MLISVLRLAAIVVAATAPEPPPGPLGLEHARTIPSNRFQRFDCLKSALRRRSCRRASASGLWTVRRSCARSTGSSTPLVRTTRDARIQPGRLPSVLRAASFGLSATFHALPAFLRHLRAD